MRRSARPFSPSPPPRRPRSRIGPIRPSPSAGRRLLPWLLRTGTLAGFDALLPLAETGPVADTFEACLAADPEPLQHHYALAVAVRA